MPPSKLQWVPERSKCAGRKTARLSETSSGRRRIGIHAVDCKGLLASPRLLESRVCDAMPAKHTSGAGLKDDRKPRRTSMRRALSLLVGLSLAAAMAVAPAQGQQDPVAQRAVDGAKAYITEKNLANPKLTILLNSLYNGSFPDFTKKWEDLTGVKMEIVPLGYTDIPAKVMQEAVSKTGVYDIFNDFPYTMPDAVGAKVIIPLDDYVKKYQPDFSGVADGLK